MFLVPFVRFTVTFEVGGRPAELGAALFDATCPKLC